jgi:hypothetical protein
MFCQSQPDSSLFDWLPSGYAPLLRHADYPTGNCVRNALLETADLLLTELMVEVLSHQQ